MATSPLAVLCRYHYDPLDRLAGTTLTAQADVVRFYQKSRLATEIQGAVQRTVFQHDDYLLAQQQRSAAGVETSLLATNQQCSVLQRVDASGAESLVYNVYGHHSAESGLSSLLGFNGERRDPITGHYLLGHGYRAFNPVLMRFNSPDSLSPFGEGGLNAYAYCQGDPVNFEDPTGHVKGKFFLHKLWKKSSASVSTLSEVTRPSVIVNAKDVLPTVVGGAQPSSSAVVTIVSQPLSPALATVASSVGPRVRAQTPKVTKSRPSMPSRASGIYNARREINKFKNLAVDVPQTKKEALNKHRRFKRLIQAYKVEVDYYKNNTARRYRVPNATHLADATARLRETEARAKTFNQAFRDRYAEAVRRT